jgi:hypothetical protein
LTTGACAAFAGSLTAQTDLMTVRGARPDSFAGSVATIGDVDGDGIQDFIVGETGDFTTTPVSTEPGRAYVFSGRDRKLLYEFVGDNPGDCFGFSVADAGDVDVLVDAQWEDDSGVAYVGAVHLYSGKTGAELFRHAGTNYFSYTGAALSALGDVNQDGHDDFIVGSPGEIVNGAVVGATRIFSGKDFSAIYTLIGPEADGYFGQAVAGGGDLNGDGVNDFVVGAPAGNSQVELGRAYVYSGADGTLLRLHGGSNWLEVFGSAVSCNADFDGDGVVDVAVGAPWATRNAELVGSIHVFSGVNGYELTTEYGKNTGSDPFYGSEFGQYVDGLKDVNGDGRDELLVGAILDQTTPGTPVGAVYMVTLADLHASWRNYGDGWPGTHCEPTLVSNAPPVLGTAITLSIGNSLGASTFALIVGGFTKASIPTSAGGTLLVQPPWFTLALPLPAAGLDLDLDVPSDVTLAGLEIDLQALETDAGATKGLSFTEGLELIFGG